MKPVTRKRVNRTALDLQSLASQHPAIGRAMRLLEDIAMKMRHDEIFAAGARAQQAFPKFDGEELGSAESWTFWDGYASTHSDFQHPGRRRRELQIENAKLISWLRRRRQRR